MARDPKTRRTMKGTGSALVDPKAKQRLEEAAKAGGFRSVSELVNLVVDSGMLALPPEDGITQRYTLKQLGEQMHSQMSAVMPKDRPSWFAGLVETQQVALVTMLRSEGYRSLVIARDFGIQEIDVHKTYAKYADDLGSQVVNVRLNTLVGHLQVAAEKASEIAMSKEDAATYWRVQKEMISVLQSLGIVNQAIRKVEIAHKFDDQKKAELDMMLDLERKQEARRLEIQVAEDAEFDTMPALALPEGGGSMQAPYKDDSDGE